MKHTTLLCTVFISIQLPAQSFSPAYIYERHYRFTHRSDTIEILVKSKSGEEHIPKPVLLFCQGSLPIPLIVYEENGMYHVFPFPTDSLLKDFHLAIVGKPHVPLVADASDLNRDMTYRDPETGDPPRGYSQGNQLDRDVERAYGSIKFLLGLDFVRKGKFVVAGHSDGSTVAAILALRSKDVSHLIYTGGNPQERIRPMISHDWGREAYTDSTRSDGRDIDRWGDLFASKERRDDTHRSLYKATYDFSIPPVRYLERMKVPVFVCYGMQDRSMPFKDSLRVEKIRQKKRNIKFKAFVGLEQVDSGDRQDGKRDAVAFSWDRVAAEWLHWLRDH